MKRSLDEEWFIADNVGQGGHDEASLSLMYRASRAARIDALEAGRPFEHLTPQLYAHVFSQRSKR